MGEKNLPEGWVVTRLGEITTKPQYGWTSKAGVVGKIKYLRTTDLSKGRVDWEAVPYCIEEPEAVSKYQVENDDILISRAGSVGLSYRIENPPQNAIFASYLIRFKPLVNPKLIEYYLQSSQYWNAISDVSAGIAVQNINAPKLSALEFPLPPLAEQNRIVAKLDTFFGHLETIKTRLEAIPQLLKNFRQAVLSQAVSGKLTETWREGKELESGLNLLNRIKANRIENYEKECFLAQKNGKRKPKQPIIEIENYNQANYTLPENWTVCSLGEIGEVLNGTTPSRPIKEYWNGHIPWISSGLVQNNRISNAKEHLTELGYANSSVKLLPKGSVLIAMIGEGKTRGQSAILDIDATINQNIAGVIFDNQFVISEYLQFWLMINYDNNRVVGNGTGPQALNCQKVRELPFVLPSTPEQQEIVSRVESLFAKADAIEAQYQSLKAKIDTLPQALLAKAFSGQLVPQNPADEPAAELLKRIKETQGLAKKVSKLSREIVA